MTGLTRELAAVPPWVLLLTVFVVPASEASRLLGLVVPDRAPCRSAACSRTRAECRWSP